MKEFNYTKANETVCRYTNIMESDRCTMDIVKVLLERIDILEYLLTADYGNKRIVLHFYGMYNDKKIEIDYRAKNGINSIGRNQQTAFLEAIKIQYELEVERLLGDLSRLEAGTPNIQVVKQRNPPMANLNKEDDAKL